MSDIIEINDLDREELRPYACTAEVQLLRHFEPEPGLFVAESPKVIRRALDAGYTPLSFLLERKYIQGQAKDILERCSHVPVYTADSDVLTQITGFRLTQGALCLMRRKPLPPVESVCKEAVRIAVLEEIMNQTNVGAVFRSAAALGFDAVLLTPGCSNPLYRRSVRVSMGTVFQVPWTYLEKGSPDYVQQLQQMGFVTAAMALTEDSVGIEYPPLCQAEKLAVILGTEGEGLKETTIQSSDYTVKIPMAHGVDSLNVAAASAVAFWQLGRHHI